MKDVLIFGASGHALVAIETLERQGAYRIVGLVDPNADVGSTVLGYPVLGRDKDVADIAKKSGAAGAILAIGDNGVRQRVSEKVASLCPSLEFVSVVDPSATVSPSAELGAGVLVMAGAVINAGAKIGAHVVVNSSAVVEHECVVGDYAHIAPQAALGGNVRMGKGVLVGLGANVAPGRALGAGAILGTGGVAVKDIPDGETWVGNPAKKFS